MELYDGALHRLCVAAASDLFRAEPLRGSRPEGAEHEQGPTPIGPPRAFSPVCHARRESLGMQALYAVADALTRRAVWRATAPRMRPWLPPARDAGLLQRIACDLLPRKGQDPP